MIPARGPQTAFSWNVSDVVLDLNNMRQEHGYYSCSNRCELARWWCLLGSKASFAQGVEGASNFIYVSWALVSLALIYVTHIPWYALLRGDDLFRVFFFVAGCSSSWRVS